MIKKKQLNSTKRTSIEKDGLSNLPSQRKSKETVKIDSSKDKGKTKKEEIGNRPISQQRSKSKGNLHENMREPKKSVYQVDQILMKKDLKQLLSKKGIRKSKEVNIVPDILKKIEENCRILKKIDNLQHQPSQKKVSKQTVSNTKSFKYSQFNNRSQIPVNKSRTKSKQIVQDSAKVIKKCRRSHQISNQHKIDDKVQSKVNSKVRHGSKTSKMIQVVQQYKKIIDREQTRVQRSSKNTNYNSNQSRNSSSLHNSHGLFNILQSMSKNHKFEDSSANMDKIQGLIKQQQSNIELSNSQKPLQDVQSHQRQNILQESQIQKRRQIQIKQFQSHKKDGQNILNKKFEIMNEKSNRSSIKYDSSSLNNALWEKDNQRSNRPFQKSKYYVQPIPPFRVKNSQQDNSLLGCEIPLIENNIINDSELPELQL